MLRLFHHHFRAMGGPNTLQLYAASETQANQAFAQAEAEVRRIEARYSRYRADSVVSRINAAAGQAWTPCDPETRHLLDLADALHQRSQGLFDLTSGVLRQIWRFTEPGASVPTDTELAPVLARIGWTHLRRQGEAVMLDQPGMELDLGGLGKEYAADRVAALWAEAGVQHGLVNLAGDLRVLGGKPDGSPWQLGIQHPRRPGELLAELPLHHGALATSGDYERCLIDAQGVRHGHILNPRTGRPAQGWQSVSVVAPLAVLAGGFSTVAMLLGPNAVDWLHSQDVDFLAIDAQGQPHSRAES